VSSKPQLAGEGLAVPPPIAAVAFVIEAFFLKLKLMSNVKVASKASGMRNADAGRRLWYVIDKIS
jgi:hypothetical protein